MAAFCQAPAAAAIALAAALSLAPEALADEVDVDPVVAAEPVVRVLLYRGPGPVRLGGDEIAPGEGEEGPELLRAGALAGARVDDPGPVVELDGAHYRGAAVVWRTVEGLWVVNELAIENYVAGILLRELPRGWNADVLRAQAVAARTFALHRQALAPMGPFHLDAEQDSQVYGGMDAEAPEALRAVEETRGQVLVYGGRPILAVYHSASGGPTAAAEEVWGGSLPYLVSRPVPEEPPATHWRIAISDQALGRALASLGLPIGAVRDVRVLERSASGRVRRAAVRGAEGSGELTGRELRRAGGLPSTRFEVERDGPALVFVGAGLGHGVGMSQWGALVLARRGVGYRAILEHFYPGTHLRGGWGRGEERPL